MKWCLVAVFSILLALWSSSCAPTPQNLLLGTWEVEGTPMKMTAEFRPNGTAAITMFGQKLEGTYTLNAANELTWSVNGRTTTAKVSVTPTELEVTDDQNRTIKYKRK